MKYVIPLLLLLLTACSTDYSTAIKEANNQIQGYEYVMGAEFNLQDMTTSMLMTCVVDRSEQVTQCLTEMNILNTQQLKLTYYATPTTVYFKDRGQWYKDTSAAQGMYDPMDLIVKGIGSNVLTFVSQEEMNGDVFLRLKLSELISELIQVSSNSGQSNFNYEEFTSEILIKKSSKALYESESYIKANTEEGMFVGTYKYTFSKFNQINKISLPSGVNSAIDISTIS